MPEEYNQKTELDESLSSNHTGIADFGMPQQGQGHYEDFTAQNVAELFGQIGGSKFKRVMEMAKTQMGKNH